MSIPFFSCPQFANNQWPRIEPRIDSILQSGMFTNGPLTRELEGALCEYTGAQHVVCVGNGTNALIFMLLAAGIGPGDEVIVPCFTFFASASSIAHAGAKPVFVDIDPVTYNIDVDQVRQLITPHTKAIMPVHLFRQMADMRALRAISEEFGMMILEDSAEGIGMSLDGVHAGRWGRAGVLSFFPTKTLGGFGDGGALLTDDSEIAQNVRMLCDNGRLPGGSGETILVGYNDKMDDIQAAVLLSRLEILDQAIKNRAALTAAYDAFLEKLSPWISTPKLSFDANAAMVNVDYVYVIEAENRGALAKHLADHEIGVEVYYPMPLHLQPCFNHLGYKTGDFPNAENACQRTVALPLYPDLTLDQVETVCSTISDFYGMGG